MLVRYERNISNNFHNCTTNRLESYRQKLKTILTRRRNLFGTIKAVGLLLLSSSKQLMTDRLGFLQKTSRFYNLNDTSSEKSKVLYELMTSYAASQVEKNFKPRKNTKLWLLQKEQIMLLWMVKKLK